MNNDRSLTVSSGRITVTVTVEIDGPTLTTRDEFDELDNLITQAKRKAHAEFMRKAHHEIIKQYPLEVPRQGHGRRSQGPFVYFAISDAKPGMIKIGRTKHSLSTRFNSMWNQLDRPSYVRAIAYVSTPVYDILERSLQAAFEECRDGCTEWFYEEPVLKFIHEHFDTPTPAGE